MLLNGSLREGYNAMGNPASVPMLQKSQKQHNASYLLGYGRYILSQYVAVARSQFYSHAEPAVLTYPAPDSRYRSYLRISLLTCWAKLQSGRTFLTSSPEQALQRGR